MVEDDGRVQLVGEYRVYGIRWIELLVFVLSIFANALHGMTFVPIIDQTKEYFQISTTQVNILASIFLFLYTIGTLISIYLSKKYSLRIVINIGALLNLGVFIRIFSLINPHQGYSLLLIGQIFSSLAAPFFLNSTALFAARWFPPTQRDIATAIGSMANPLGSAIGSLLPSLIINGNQATSEQFLNLLLSEALFTLIVTIFTVILFRSYPPTPPSSSEEHHPEIHFKEDFIKLMTNRHYLTLLFGFSLGLAIFNALITVLDQIIKPSGYTSDDAGVFGAAIILAGLFNAVLAGLIMDKTHAYKQMLKILLIGAVASGIFFILILRPNQFYPLTVSIGLMGFFLLPLLPVSFECAVECTYPINAELSQGILLCVGNILGVIFIFIFEQLISLAPTYQSGQILTPTSIFMLCIFGISGVSLFIYRGPYLRLEAEREESQRPILNI